MRFVHDFEFITFADSKVNDFIHSNSDNSFILKGCHYIKPKDLLILDFVEIKYVNYLMFFLPACTCFCGSTIIIVIPKIEVNC